VCALISFFKLQKKRMDLKVIKVDLLPDFLALKGCPQ
jgi:hypothetical protein